MTTNAGTCQDAMEVRVDDGLKNTSFEIPDPAFLFPLGFNWVCKDTTGMIRPVRSYATVEQAALDFQGIVNSSQFPGTTTEKKMQVYHHGDAVVYLDSATSVEDGDLLRFWLDPATGLISNTTFAVTVTPTEAVLTVCGRCVCPGYENDPCTDDGAATDVSPSTALAAQTLLRVKATWNVDSCGV